MHLGLSLPVQFPSRPPLPFPGSQTPPSTRREPNPRQQQLRAASPQCTKRDLFPLCRNFTSAAAPAPAPASPTFVPGETPNPTAPRAGSPQLPQLKPLRRRRRRRIRNGFAQMCCTTPEKAEARLAEKPVPGSPGEPQTARSPEQELIPGEKCSPHARDGPRFAPWCHQARAGNLGEPQLCPRELCFLLVSINWRWKAHGKESWGCQAQNPGDGNENQPNLR